MSKSNGSLAISLAGYSMVMQGLLFPFRLAVRKLMPKMGQIAQKHSELKMQHENAKTPEDNAKLNGDMKSFFWNDIFSFVRGAAPFAILWSLFFFRSWTVLREMCFAAPLATSPFLFLPTLCGPKYLERFGLAFAGMPSGPVRILYFVLPYLLARKEW